MPPGPRGAPAVPPPPNEATPTVTPVIHAEVGDVVEVVLRNDTRRPVSLHAHGLRYDKASEGAPYSDGTSGDAKVDDAVKPGATRTYR